MLIIRKSSTAEYHIVIKGTVQQVLSSTTGEVKGYDVWNELVTISLSLFYNVATGVSVKALMNAQHAGIC